MVPKVNGLPETAIHSAGAAANAPVVSSMMVLSRYLTFKKSAGRVKFWMNYA